MLRLEYSNTSSHFSDRSDFFKKSERSLSINHKEFLGDQSVSKTTSRAARTGGIPQKILLFALATASARYGVISRILPRSSSFESMPSPGRYLLKTSCFSVVAKGLMHWWPKVWYNSSLRPHNL